MAVHLYRSLRVLVCLAFFLDLISGLVPGSIQIAAAACPDAGTTSVPTVTGPPTGLPDTGAGGGVDFCAQNPDQCQSTASSADAGAVIAVVSDDPVPHAAFAASGGFANRGPSGLLMLAVGATRSSDGMHIGASQCAGPPDPQSGPAPTPCPPLPGPPPLPDARQVALGIPVPYPEAQIAINPSPPGLTGLPSWFWIDGYDGRPFSAATTINVPPQVPPGYPSSCPQPAGASLQVTVQFSPTSYDWTFGDQLSTSTLTAISLGTAYPRPSDIQHTYQYTSLGLPNGFLVSVRMHFSVRYQANGGLLQGLPDVAKTYSRAYPVQQAQSVLVNGR